jgi:homoserine O-succinyltransferase
VRDGDEFLDLVAGAIGTANALAALSPRAFVHRPSHHDHPRSAMPIRIPDDLPARKTLEAEGVVVMDSTRAARQDIRPLQIGLLNLMPNKERTETQFTRLIGATPLQIDLTLVRVTDHQSKNTSEDYLKTFYSTWERSEASQVRRLHRDRRAHRQHPVRGGEVLDEMVEIMEWTQTNVHHTMFICWGAQAALHHFHKARRYRMEKKAFGVFRHKIVSPGSHWLRGFSDSPMVPVSRYNDIARDSLGDDLRILIDNDEIGVCLHRRSEAPGRAHAQPSRIRQPVAGR